MPSKILMALSALLLISMGTANAQTETVLHTFLGGTDGAGPGAGVILDSLGNLYGTTGGGGGGNNPNCIYAGGCGTVFEISPTGNGWTEIVLHSFGTGLDGFQPSGALAFDGSGNLYGTTLVGGASGNGCGGAGCGTVFELSPLAGGGWSEKVLYSFAGGEDGYNPVSSLTFDASGNLYGTTLYWGVHRKGTLFQLTPGANGSWSERVLHNFGASVKDGQLPECNLAIDAAGNLYGTTTGGGAYGSGIVFELSPAANGSWAEKGLHSFGNNLDGKFPYGGLTFDAAGNLYGATVGGGAGKNGTIFELSPNLSGDWTERLLHSFGVFSGGGIPNGNLVFDPAGNIYGTASEGGLPGCVRPGCGIVFKLSPASGGNWQETVINSFSANIDGGFPLGGVVLDSSGNIYGTTLGGSGNSSNYGTVFEVTQ